MSGKCLNLYIKNGFINLVSTFSVNRYRPRKIILSSLLIWLTYHSDTMETKIPTAILFKERLWLLNRIERDLSLLIRCMALFKETLWKIPIAQLASEFTVLNMSKKWSQSAYWPPFPLRTLLSQTSLTTTGIKLSNFEFASGVLQRPWQNQVAG